tara:strand:+ start:2506 stop:4668 length:2163 start_codon:yes stop_codon:yes gene_type:complete
MAEKKESIEISYKANMTDLTKKLAEMPNITSKEAKKMVGALDRQLKQAENAAKRSSAASKKAMKASSAAAKKGAKDFKKLASSASMVAVSVLAMGAGVIGFTQKIADLTNELTDASTKTGIAIETLAGLRLAAEGSGLEFSNLEAGLIRFSKSMVDSESGSKKLEDAFGSLDVKVKDSNGNFRTTNDTFQDVMKSLSEMEPGAKRNAIAMELFGRTAGPGLIQSGALDNLAAMTALAKEFGVAINENGVDAMANFQRSMAEFSLVSQGTLENLINAITGDNGGLASGIEMASSAMVFFGSIGEGVIDSYRNGFEAVSLQIQAVIALASGDIKLASFLSSEGIDKALEGAKTYSNLLDDAVDDVARFNELSAITRDTQKDIAKTLKEELETEEDLEKKKKAREKAAKAIAKAEKEALEALKLQQKIQKANQTLTEKIQDSLVSNFDMFATEHEKELNRITEKENQKQLQISRNLASEIEAINEIEKLTGETVEAEMARGLAREDAEQASNEATIDRMNAIEDLKKENAEKESERVEAAAELSAKMAAQQFQQGVELANAAVAFAGASMDLQDQLGRADEDAVLKAFKRRQALGVATIAISTAEGVMDALAKYGPIAGPALAGVIIATGAMQAGAVAAQPPPTFHMGGLNPDEGNARILKGEAVLDRETVRRIGGESGVKNLQQGGESGSGSVVIIQPFKHFGRFAKEIGYKKPRRTGIGSY